MIAANKAQRLKWTAPELLTLLDNSLDAVAAGGSFTVDGVNSDTTSGFFA